MLKEDEVIDMIDDEIKIIQSNSLFKYGTDAVLLSEFANVKKGGNVLDFCTGSGIIPLLLYKRFPDSLFEALEISEKSSDMAKRTMELNNLSDKIKVTKGDVKEAAEIYKGRQFDLITCNPPYMDQGGGLINPESDKAIARHEVLCNLEDIIKNASKLLKFGGYFSMVHRPRRLTDIMYYMRKYKIEPKRLTLVCDRVGKEPDMVLIEGAFGGGKYLKTDVLYINEGE